MHVPGEPFPSLRNFNGEKYRLASNWYGPLPLGEYQHRPIKYLEIGAYYGANLLSVADSYGRHPESEIYCIDPWEDYGEYSEYKGRQNSIYDAFLENIENSGHKGRIKIRRGYSHNEILKFEDDFFDIIYIDGNHEPEYVLEDAVLSFRKLKSEGVLIFDDYGWGPPDRRTQTGIDAFTTAYKPRLEDPGVLHEMQLFVKKLH